MRRTRVKYSDRPQPAAAMNAAPKAGCQRTADPGKPNQQQEARNRDKNIIEPAQQPELFLINDRRRAHAAHKTAKSVGSVAGQNACAHGIVEINSAVHWASF